MCQIYLCIYTFFVLKISVKYASNTLNCFTLCANLNVKNVLSEEHVAMICESEVTDVDQMSQIFNFTYAWQNQAAYNSLFPGSFHIRVIYRDIYSYPRNNSLRSCECSTHVILVKIDVWARQEFFPVWKSACGLHLSPL